MQRLASLPGSQIWNLDSQLMLNSHATEGDKPSVPSHRARLFQKWLRLVIKQGKGY
jgi:hypothetical protein